MTIILTSNQSCNSLLDKNSVRFRILRYNRKERVAINDKGADFSCLPIFSINN